MTAMLSGAPFVTPTHSVGAIMRTVIYALIPGIAVYVWFFGWAIVISIVLACVTALLCEAAMLVIRGRPVVMYLTDGSALVTAILLALALPSAAPWWIPVVGSAFAIVIAKHLYGGIGYNPFNPAMIGYAVLLVSFPREMSMWPAPTLLSGHTLDLADSARLIASGHFGANLTIDTISAATPFDLAKTELGTGKELRDILVAPIYGRLGGSGMEWVNLSYAMGGLWLLFRRVITWHIPVAMLASLLTISCCFHWIDPTHALNPMLHLVGGATMLGAFFIATDPVTAATTPRGRLIYGAGIGLLTYAIRTWSGYPDGVAFAVLLMGLAAPLIDRYSRPRAFGEKPHRASNP